MRTYMNRYINKKTNKTIPKYLKAIFPPLYPFWFSSQRKIILPASPFICSYSNNHKVDSPITKKKKNYNKSVLVHHQSSQL